MLLSNSIAWGAFGLVGAAALASAVSLPSPSDFKMHSISVNHELGGSTHQTSQLHVFEQPKGPDSSSKYFIGLSPAEAATLSWAEVNLKIGAGIEPEQRGVADLHYEGSVSEIQIEEPTHLYSVTLPPYFMQNHDPNDRGIVTPNITVAVDLLFQHLSQPLPKAVSQKQDASLQWQGDVHPRTPYGCPKVRVKARSPNPTVHSYSVDPPLEDETLASKTGAVVTFGPFGDIPPLKANTKIRKASVHYLFQGPIVGVVSLDRHVEVSHWAAAVSVQDRVWLRNNGPMLKGHFSRVDHQVGAFYGGAGRNLLTDFAIHLPSGARDAYFVDQIGNVSTSHFRSAPADEAHVSKPSYQLANSGASYLQLQPRYPLMGGWNYTFTTGWNLPSGEGGWVKRISGAGRREFSVAVPFWQAIQDVPADRVTTTIVLPEGATVLDVQSPFEVDDEHRRSISTYLDTVGRPAIVLEKHRVSERHSGNVYIRYSLDGPAHLLKPLSVAGAGMAAFATALVFRRLQAK
ncbi:unnamed protein product [Jaminaea pallidilutea]